MKYYWPISNSTYDVVGGKHLKLDLNGELADDRFGTPGGSIYFNNGYGSVAPGVYFDPTTGGFTVMAWMKFVSISTWMRLFDFGLGPVNDNVMVHVCIRNDTTVNVYAGLKVNVKGRQAI